MVTIDLDEKLHEKIKAFVEKNKLDYPTVKHAVNQAVKQFLERNGFSVDVSATMDACPKAEVEG